MNNIKKALNEIFGDRESGQGITRCECGGVVFNGKCGRCEIMHEKQKEDEHIKKITDDVIENRERKRNERMGL